MKKLLSLFLAMLLLCGCSHSHSQNTIPCKAYYFSSASANELVPCEFSIEGTNIEDVANKLFFKLYSPPKKNLVSPFFSRVRLIDLTLNNNRCDLVLSPSYRYLDVFDLTALNSAIVNTMCSLPGIDEVSISCDGKSTIFSAEEFVTQLPRAHYETHTVNLYFTKDNFTEVVKETAEISLSPDETLEKSVVLLLKNETSDSYDSPFPEDTVINDVYFDEGVCFVDVSKEFILNAIHKQKEETVVLFSIVNTLTELPKIDSVQFLIDGDIGYGYGHHNIKTPFTNNTELFDTN